MAIQLIPTLAPVPQQASQALGQSDEQLDHIRQYIAALRAAKQPVQHWAQGASNLAGDLLEGAARGKVNDALGQRQAGATQEYVRALNTPGSQPDETSLSTGPRGGPLASSQTNGAGAPSTAAAPMAPGGDDQLTRIAAVVNQGETGRGHNFDAQSLGNISPDTHGSKSYGFMGLNSKSGSAAEFARRYGADLGLSAPPGSAEFDGQWRTASAQRSDAMRKAQMDHFRETQLQPVYSDLQKLGIPTAVASDPRVLTYFADRHVQMGKLGQDNIVNAWQASGNDPVKFLHNIDQMDGTGQSLQRFFPNALAQGIYSARGHAMRLATRLGGALGLGPSEPAQIASAEGAPTGGADPHVQSMVQALAGQQTAQAGPPPGAIGAPPSGGTLAPMQHMANFLRMGYTPQQAAQRVQEMQGMMPQYKYDDPYGREYAETPGQPRRYTGRQFGPGKEVTQGGIAFSENLGPNNEVVRTPIMPRFPGQQPAGAAPPVMPPAGSPGAAWTPKQGSPPFPRDMEELQAYPAKMDAFKSYQVEGGKESALLEQKRTPEQQAFENQQIREKEEARIAADTSPQAIEGTARKTALTEQAKEYVKKHQMFEKQAADSQAELPQLNLLKRVIANPDFYSGIFSKQVGDIKQLADKLGMQPSQAASLMQFAKKLGAAGSLEQIREMGQQGAVRVPEMHMIEKSNFDPENTQEANAAVVEIRARLAQRSMEIADLANKYADEHGGLIDRKFDQFVRDNYRDKPLIADAELENYNTLLDRKKPASTERRPAYQPAPPPGALPVGR